MKKKIRNNKGPIKQKGFSCASYNQSENVIIRRYKKNYKYIMAFQPQTFDPLQYGNGTYCYTKKRQSGAT